MTRFITIASGKGGTGKTTTALNLGVALRNLGREVTVLDANLTTPNIGLHLGVPKSPTTLNDVMEGRHDIHQATYLHASNLKIIPADISITAAKKPSYKKLKTLFKQLQGTTEIVIVDSAAGLGSRALACFDHSDEVLIVTNPNLAAVTDALKTIKFAEEKGTTVIGIVLNKIRNDKTELSISNVEAILGMPIIAEIPYSDEVRQSQKNKQPLVYSCPNSSAADSFKNLAAKLIGEEYTSPLVKSQKGFWYSIFRILGYRQ